MLNLKYSTTFYISGSFNALSHFLNQFVADLHDWLPYLASTSFYFHTNSRWLPTKAKVQLALYDMESISYQTSSFQELPEDLFKEKNTT